jgi:signal peptidase
MSLLLRILRGAGTALLLAVPALILLVTAPMATGNSPLHVYTVTSNSMDPQIPVKSAVLVDERLPHTVGDIVTFRLGDDHVTHRIVAIEADGTYVTKGDALMQEDPFTITAADVVGPVVGSVPGLGWWLYYLQLPLGVGSAIAAAIAIWLVISVTRDLVREAEAVEAARSVEAARHQDGPGQPRAAVLVTA